MPKIKVQDPLLLLIAGCTETVTVNTVPPSQIEVKSSPQRNRGGDVSDERIYPCVKCGLLRSKAEGGTTFSVCDSCWGLCDHGADADCKEVLAKVSAALASGKGEP